MRTGRPPLHSTKKRSVAISLTPDEIKSCTGWDCGTDIHRDERDLIAQAAVRGGTERRLDWRLNRRGVVLIDCAGGYRLVVQGKPEDLPAMREALAWFEANFKETP